MPEPRNVRIMISSRSTSEVRFEGASEALTLESLRKEIKQGLEEVEVFGKQLLEVWIHEDAQADDASNDAWEESLAQIAKADIVLVLFNGEAGWTIPGGSQGICHDEMAKAIEKAPAKVRMVELSPLAALPEDEEGLSDEAEMAMRRDLRFREYVDAQARWRTLAESKEALLDAVDRSIRAGLDQLVNMGSRAAAVGGPSHDLNWDLLDFERRRRAMIRELRQALEMRRGEPRGEHGMVLPTDDGSQLYYIRCDAVPAAMSVAAAREMVGQPFLHVRELAGKIRETDATAGPIHLVACHKGVTESQAMKILGFPDATIVAAPFGVYVADDVHKIQLVFIAGCRNPSAVHHGVQRLFAWLEQADEEERLIGRAESRLRIINAIAEEAPDNF